MKSDVQDKVTSAISDMVRVIVRHPDWVSMIVKLYGIRVCIEVKSHPDDIGRLIGQDATVVCAMRRIVAAAVDTASKNVDVRILQSHEDLKLNDKVVKLPSPSQMELVQAKTKAKKKPTPAAPSLPAPEKTSDPVEELEFEKPAPPEPPKALPRVMLSDLETSILSVDALAHLKDPVHEVMLVVSKVWDVPVECFTSKAKPRRMAHGRLMAICIVARWMDTLTDGDIGRRFGRDRTLVIYAKRKVIEWVSSPGEYKVMYEKCLQELAQKVIAAKQLRQDQVVDKAA